MDVRLFLARLLFLSTILSISAYALAKPDRHVERPQKEIPRPILSGKWKEGHLVYEFKPFIGASSVKMENDSYPAIGFFDGRTFTVYWDCYTGRYDWNGTAFIGHYGQNNQVKIVGGVLEGNLHADSFKKDP